MEFMSQFYKWVEKKYKELAKINNWGDCPNFERKKIYGKEIVSKLKIYC